MKTDQIIIHSPSHDAFVSITSQINQKIKDLGIKDALINLFILHTTCALTINENADPNVVQDLLERLNHMIPWNFAKDRHAEGNSAAHLKSSFMGSSLQVPCKNGKLVLGTWQGVFLTEFDGPKTRTIFISAIEAK